jgi:hypothetical protein
MARRTASTPELENLLARIEARDRLSLEEWRRVEDQASTEDLGHLANLYRQHLHPDGVVT